ncbi:hypothetical protein F5X97DRAFT_209739 [Nemania serpens]|nr:hypothetical protein F5X97DRAFT_209739 [Nemania serpens]
MYCTYTKTQTITPVPATYTLCALLLALCRLSVSLQEYPLLSTQLHKTRAGWSHLKHPTILTLLRGYGALIAVVFDTSGTPLFSDFSEARHWSTTSLFSTHLGKHSPPYVHLQLSPTSYFCLPVSLRPILLISYRAQSYSSQARERLCATAGPP